MLLCEKCESEIQKKDAFCHNCGAQITKIQEQDNAKSKKKSNKRGLLFSIGVLGIVLCLIGGLAYYFIRGKREIIKSALYIKNGEVWCANTKNAGTQKICNLEGDAQLFYITSTVSGDGKYLFYIEKENGSDVLCRRNIEKANPEIVEIDRDVSNYSINDSGNRVAYITEDRTLYLHNMESEEKIAGSVDLWKLSKKGDAIVYSVIGSGLYRKEETGNSEQLTSEIDPGGLIYITEDCQIIYYVSNNVLYKWEKGEKTIRIASDISKVVKVCETGEAYYMRENSNIISITDYLDGDAQEKFDTLADKYDVEMHTQSTYSLYYYNGKSEQLLTEAATGEVLFSLEGKYTGIFDMDFKYSANQEYRRPVLVYYEYKEPSEDKVTLSEIRENDNSWTMMHNFWDCIERSCVVAKQNVVTLEQKETHGFLLNNNGNKLCFSIGDSEEMFNDLYTMDISEGKIGEAKLYAEAVCLYDFNYEGDLLYTDRADCGFYLNEDMVTQDGIFSCVECFGPDIVYENVERSLQLCNTDTVEITKDVKDWTITREGVILYITNYDTEQKSGDLYCYVNGKATLLDNNVESLIYFSHDVDERLLIEYH